MGSDSLTQRAVFLDRDGVLNRARVENGIPLPPRTVDEVEILPEVPEALSQLRDAALQLIVVTNQPDVARGVQERSVVEAINKYLMSQLPLHAVRVCYHDDDDECCCRKPKPGLLSGAAAELNIGLRSSFMIGDRWRDIGAGRAAGCQTILIDRGYREGQECQPDRAVSDLLEATDWILSQTTGPRASEIQGDI